MIRVNTAEIGPDGLPLVGEEKPDFLELDTTKGIPVKVLENVKYNFHASMAGQDLLVTGSAFTRIRTECSKCLKEIEIRIGSDKICIFKEKVPDEIIDLTDDVREDILLSLPTRFKCSENCRGLCPGCGADLNTEPCRCHKQKQKKAPQEDHTWDVLDDLKF